MLTDEEREALLEEARDSRRGAVLRRARRRSLVLNPEAALAFLDEAASLFIDRRPRRWITGRHFLL